MAKRPLNRLGKIMKKCSPKTRPTSWKKMKYPSYQECVRKEAKKK